MHVCLSFFLSSPLRYQLNEEEGGRQAYIQTVGAPSIISLSTLPWASPRWQRQPTHRRLNHGTPRLNPERGETVLELCSLVLAFARNLWAHARTSDANDRKDITPPPTQHRAGCRHYRLSPLRARRCRCNGGVKYKVWSCASLKMGVSTLHLIRTGGWRMIPR